MINDETYKLYLTDLCTLLKERAALAYLHKDETQIDKGILFGYHEVLMALKDLFDAFSIDPKEVNMHDFNPEDLLLEKFHYPLSDSAKELDMRGRKIAQKWIKKNQ